MRFSVLASLIFAVSAFGQTGPQIPSRYYRTFSHTNAIFQRIQPGAVVSTRTLDSGGQNEKNEHVGEPANPLTGPFYIEGAQPGDALVVRLRKVRLNRNWGYTSYRLGLFSMTPESVEGIYPNHYKADLIRKGRDNMVPWDIDLAKGTVRLREPVSSKMKLEFPARPMLGCIGVAAPGDFAPTSAPSGNYGGNLDYNEIGEGSTVILPVFHPGGLLFLGDAHALSEALRQHPDDPDAVCISFVGWRAPVVRPYEAMDPGRQRMMMAGQSTPGPGEAWPPA